MPIIKYSLTFAVTFTDEGRRLLDRPPADKRDSGGEASRLMAMLMRSLGGHDLNVLESAVCRGVVSAAAGNARAVAHHDRRGGQLCQTLVQAVNCWLIWKIQTRHSVTNQRIKGYMEIQYRQVAAFSNPLLASAVMR